MNVGGSDAPDMAMGPENAENPDMGMESPAGGMVPEDDGVGEEEYAQDIINNLEEHLNSLPDEAKGFLADVVAIPEFSAAIALINGKEVGDYFMKYADPSKSLGMLPSEQKPAAPAPQNTQPSIQPAPQAPQGGGIMRPQAQQPM